jgi:putative transposase
MSEFEKKASISQTGGVRRPRPTAEPAPALPERDHLKRLGNVFAKDPLYFLTCCTAQRRKVLATDASAEVLRSAFAASSKIHGWHIGRYVIMPDHVHFFGRPQIEAKSLSAVIRDWKKWTSREIARIESIDDPIWQPEFFDHVLRSADSYSEKWEYVRQNPVRAGLATKPDEWPYSGECIPLEF